MKLGQNICLYEISDEFKIGLCGAKARSQGRILEKPCVRNRGDSFGPILINLVLEKACVCVHEISDEFKFGSYGVKN